jgi:hypothetical protein
MPPLTPARHKRSRPSPLASKRLVSGLYHACTMHVSRMYLAYTSQSPPKHMACTCLAPRMYLASGGLRPHSCFLLSTFCFISVVAFHPSSFASGSHWCRIGVALGSQWGAYRLAINTLWGGSDVALMSHWGGFSLALASSSFFILHSAFFGHWTGLITSGRADQFKETALHPGLPRRHLLRPARLHRPSWPGGPSQLL